MEPISFSGDSLGPDLLPLDELADCAGAVLERDGKTVLSYGSGAGYTPLRELIAEWFGVHPYRVLLTNGSLQGLALLARRIAPGRNVIAEYPVYDRAQYSLLQSGGVLTSVMTDEWGMNTDELHQLLTQYLRPALVYTIPTFNNPTGCTMALDRRRALVEEIRAQNRLQVEDILLVEDDSYALTRFEGERLPALFDLSGKTSVYSSSFSTTIAPGLRVGWLILPDALAAELIEAANATYITPVLLAQATVYEFMRRGSFEPHLIGLRQALKLRRDTMLAALAEHFPEATWSRPEGGCFVWLRLPGLTDSRRVLARAEGVTARPGTDFGATADFVRLSYGDVTPEEIGEGVARLAFAAAPAPG